MECPVCHNYSYKDICPECGFDLENEAIYNRYIYELSYSERDKRDQQIKILKQNYQLSHKEEKTILDEAEELNKKAQEYEDLYFYDEDEEDYEKAIHYYKLAIEKGSIDAIINLALMYREKVRNEPINKERQRTLKESADLLEKAVKLENTKAMKRLAEAYLFLFFGRFPSTKKAIQLYLKAIELGDGTAANELSRNYRNGCGLLRKNIDKANEYKKIYEDMKEDAGLCQEKCVRFFENV